MPDNLVTWDDYTQSFDVLGGAANEELLGEIMKALSAGYTDPPVAGGDALRVEDLSATLAWAEIQEKHLKLFRKLRKDAAYSTVAEWARVDSLDDGGDGFIAGNDTGNVSDATYSRLTKPVKYMGVMGEVTLPTQLIRTIGLTGAPAPQALQTQKQVKTRDLLKRVERALFAGDSSLATLHWDGFKKQIVDANSTAKPTVLDMRGAAPDKEMLENASQLLLDNYGLITDIYMPATVRRDLKEATFPAARYPDGAGMTQGTAFSRWVIESMGGDADTAELHTHVILRAGQAEPTAAQTNGPTRPTTVSGVAAGSGSQLSAGTYWYSAVAVGKLGKSQARAAVAGVAATAGQEVTVTIVNGDVPDTLYYEVYRGTSNSATARKYLTSVAAAAGGADTAYVDDGTFISGTSDAFCFSLDPQEVYFKQLSPLLFRELPLTMMATPFAILLFGTPIMETPTKNLLIRNIGAAS